MKKSQKAEATDFQTAFGNSADCGEECVVRLQRQCSQLAEALRELYQLLEEYGPAWYTKDQHERAESALRLLQDSDSIPSNNGVSQEYIAALTS